MDFAEKIRRARDEKGLTLREVSKQTGIPKSTLHNWECGAGVVMKGKHVAYLLRVLNIYQIELREIFECDH